MLCMLYSLCSIALFLTLLSPVWPINNTVILSSSLTSTLATLYVIIVAIHCTCVPTHENERHDNPSHYWPSKLRRKRFSLTPSRACGVRLAEGSLAMIHLFFIFLCLQSRYGTRQAFLLQAQDRCRQYWENRVRVVKTKERH
jgi:hypothetical protein